MRALEKLKPSLQWAICRTNATHFFSPQSGVCACRGYRVETERSSFWPLRICGVCMCACSSRRLAPDVMTTGAWTKNRDML